MFNCDISEVIYVVDLKTKELFVVKATSGIVLDVLDDEILMLHRSELKKIVFKYLFREIRKGGGLQECFIELILVEKKN